MRQLPVKLPPLPVELPSPPGDWGRVRPDVLLITLLDDLNVTFGQVRDMVAQMGRLLSSMESKMEMVPMGVVEVFDNLPVSGTEENAFDTIDKTDRRWYSATVYNIGPDDIQARAGEIPDEFRHLRRAWRDRWMTLSEGESIDIDFKAPLLRYIYYRGAAATTSSTLKITGEW